MPPLEVRTLRDPDVGLFLGATVTNYHQLGGCRQQKCILLWFQQREVQSQGVSRALLLPVFLWRVLPGLFLAPHSCLPSLVVHGWEPHGSSLCSVITGPFLCVFLWFLQHGTFRVAGGPAVAQGAKSTCPGERGQVESALPL